MEHEEISRLLEENRAILDENKRLIEKNNEFLRKMHRNAVLSFWFRIAWFLILLGLPILLYIYLLQPLMESLPFGDSSSLLIPIEELQPYIDRLPQ